MAKLKIEKLIDSINYYDTFPTFRKGNGEVLTFEELPDLGLPEDEYPFDVKEFKKLKLGFSGVEYECHENDRMITYDFDKKNHMVVIETEEFTIKECFIIIDMIRRQLEATGAGDFIAFGNFDDEVLTQYHEEGTAFGMWWKEFYELFMERVNSNNQKLHKVYILTDDYQTEEEGWSTKDRVICIVLE